MKRVTDSAAPEKTPGFGERGRMRRRARFLRKARELAYRDLGGLVFDLHRFGQRNDPVVMAKLATLRQMDTELRALEDALRERRGVTVLREVGIAACPRCAAIHGSDDRFCPGCGLAFDTNAERPMSTAPVTPGPSPMPSTAQASPQGQPATPVASPSAPPATQAQAHASQAPVPTGAPSRPQTPATTPQAPAATPPRPAVDPAPPAKPTASPVPARPTEQTPAEKRPADADEDEPTRILRPGGSGA